MILNDDEDDTTFMPAPDIWIETRHELPPYDEVVRVKDSAGGEAKAIRMQRRNGMPDFWMTNEKPFALYGGGREPVAWRYLTDKEKR